MKTIVRKLIFMMLLFASLFSVSSCEPDDWWDDDWYGGGGLSEDEMLENEIVGTWHVSRVNVELEPCPYYPRDVFRFRSDGYLRVLLGDGTADEGVWWVDDACLMIDFGGSREPEFYGYIDKLDRHFLSVDVEDYVLEDPVPSRYYMELVR